MNKLYEMLMTEAVAQKAKALLSLDLLANRSVGIGDHSTKDFYANAEEALLMLVEADDKVEALKKYFIIADKKEQKSERKQTD